MSDSNTLLQCLALVARHHKIDVTAERLCHEYGVDESGVDEKLFRKICIGLKLKFKERALSWDSLYRIGGAFPVIARLDNGNHVVLVAVSEQTEDGKEAEAAIFDPLAEAKQVFVVRKSDFEKRWTGGVIFIKPISALLDEEQRFGLRWFVPEIWRQRRYFRDVVFAALAINLVALAVPIFFQLVIDKVLVHQVYSTLHVLGIGIAIALIFDAILNFLRSYLLLHATTKIDIRVAKRTFSHLLSLPGHFFDANRAGVLTKHMQQSATIRQFLTGSLFMTLLDASALAVFIPVLFFYSGLLSFVVLFFTALLVVIIAILIPPFRRRLHRLYQAEADRQSLLVESIHGIATIKALALEPGQRRTWEEKSARAVMMQLKVGKISITAQAFSQLLEKLMIVAVIWVGAYQVFEGTMTIGALVAFQMLAGRVTGPMVQMIGLIHEYQEAALSVRMLGSVINQEPERGLSFSGLREPIKGGIAFENVTFRYAPDLHPALDNVTVEIPAGTVVGLVGRSGSGKTTFTRLIQSVVQPQAGIVRIDNVDIREIDLPHLRQNIGVVLQENFLFQGSVRDNIAMAKPSASFQEVVDAARLSGASEFIEKLPRSFETMIEEGAVNLSGGQKQRIAISRALIVNPRILILDEATSALDPESEALVKRHLSGLARGRTVVIVSHRLSMLTSADVILVLDNGKIICQGPHRALLEKCMLYRELWQQQHSETRPASHC